MGNARIVSMLRVHRKRCVLLIKIGVYKSCKIILDHTIVLDYSEDFGRVANYFRLILT